MKVEKKFSWKAMLVLTFVLTAMFSMSVFASTTAPSKVTGLKQTSASTTAVGIAWDSVLGSDIYYEVEYSTDAAYWVQYEDYANTNDSIYNLSSGKSYYVRVRAYSRTYNYDTYKYDVVTGEWSDALEVVTKPQLSVASYGSITQTAATKNSITIKWPTTTGASYYDVYVEDVKVGSSYTTTYTVKGLAASSKYDVDVYPVRRSATGYVATGYSMYDFNYATAPGKVANVIASTSSTLTSSKLEWSALTNADGYEIWLYKYNGKKPIKKITNTYNSYSLDNLSRKMFYKVKVRGYVNVGTTKVYGEWSKFTEFAQPLDGELDATSGIKKIIVSYKKVKGAKNYTIYMSTKKDSGYKKIATTKKTKYVIKKFKKKSIKLNKKYYVIVVANRKSGKNTIQSFGAKGDITIPK